MRAAIYCEGTTDVMMIQFVLQYKYDWKYQGFEENTRTNRLIKRVLTKNEKIIEVFSCAGINNIPKQVCKFKEKMEYATKEDECCDKLIIMIDHDTVKSNSEFMSQLNEELGTNFDVSQMGAWEQWEISNFVLGKKAIDIYIESIPASKTGAIESILMDALATDETEEKLVKDCEEFIGSVEKSQQRYLQKKSRTYKAIFNTYFSIRAPEEKYDERARVLKAYDWKNNPVLNKEFCFLDI